MKTVALSIAEWSILAAMALLIVLPWTDAAAPRMVTAIERLRVGR